MREELLYAPHWIRSGLTETADGSVGHRSRQVREQRKIPFAVLHDMHGLCRACAARRALPARLVSEELHEIECCILCAVVIRKNDDCRAADEASVLREDVEVERLIGERGREN